jgi:HSP20 family protein
LADVIMTDKEVKVVIEVPYVSKQNIKINAYDTSVEVFSNDPERKYHQVFDLPPQADIKTVRSTYKNGILEITFKKKKSSKPKVKRIKVE